MILNVTSVNFGKGKNCVGRYVSSLKNCGQKGKRKGLIVEKNNGVDISDLMRFYSKEEWKKLDANVKKKILESPASRSYMLRRISVMCWQLKWVEILRMG